MFDLEEFLFFNGGTTETGITFNKIELIYRLLNSQKLKKDYLLASAPNHTIIHDSFYIKKKLITIKEFRSFIKESSYVTESEIEGWGWLWNGKWIKKENVNWKKPFQNKSDELYNEYEEILPVIQISWNDAYAYTQWLRGKTGNHYRLPHEFEWELLAQYADFKSLLSYPELFNNNKIASDELYIQNIKEQLDQTKFQLGILWEWMFDWYKGYDETVKNKDFGYTYKTLRGGSLLSENFQKTKEFRFRRCPTARSPYYGFRVVLSLSE